MIENPGAYESSNAKSSGLTSFVAKTYLWMFFGLLLTFGISFGLMYSGIVYQLYVVMWPLLIAEIVLVLVLSLRITKIKPTTATVLFLLYAVVNGVTLSPIMSMYKVSSVVMVFAVAALAYGVMAVYGLVTKQDLTRWGKFFFFALIGVLLMTLVAVLFRLSGLNLIISYVGLAVFLGITAYDNQRIKTMYLSYGGGDAAIEQKIAIIGALQMYLDFINIFLYLLRIMGKRN